MRFTSTARKDDRWWVVQCDQHPGALSQVARLDQAVMHQREAIAFVAGLDEAEVDVEVRPALPQRVEKALVLARQRRGEAEHAQADAAEHWKRVALELQRTGLSVRDIGAVLGVSHQRAHQLVSEAKSQSVA